MKLMRRSAIRLFVLLLYASTLAALPAYWNAPKTGGMRTCSCPMCRALGGAHHCGCCQGEKCTCGMSSGEKGTQVILVVEPAILCSHSGLRIVLPSEYLILGAPHSSCIPDLPIPTPPPKS